MIWKAVLEWPICGQIYKRRFEGDTLEEVEEKLKEHIEYLTGLYHFNVSALDSITTSTEEDLEMSAYKKLEGKLILFIMSNGTAVDMEVQQVTATTIKGRDNQWQRQEIYIADIEDYLIRVQ